MICSSHTNSIVPIKHMIYVEYSCFVYIPDSKYHLLSLSTQTNYKHTCINMFNTPNISPCTHTVDPTWTKQLRQPPDKPLTRSIIKQHDADISLWSILDSLQWGKNIYCSSCCCVDPEYEEKYCIQSNIILQRTY